VLRHQQTTAEGQLVDWDINQECASALEAVNNEPHRVLGKVTFHVSRDWPGVKLMQADVYVHV